MTHAALAERVCTTASVISLLESGSRSLRPSWARPLARVLGTSPGALLDYGPGDSTEDLLRSWAAIPAHQKLHALEVLRTFERAPFVASGG